MEKRVALKPIPIPSDRMATAANPGARSSHFSAYRTSASMPGRYVLSRPIVRIRTPVNDECRMPNAENGEMGECRKWRMEECRKWRMENLEWRIGECRNWRM